MIGKNITIGAEVKIDSTECSSFNVSYINKMKDKILKVHKVFNENDKEFDSYDLLVLDNDGNLHQFIRNELVIVLKVA